MKAKLMVELIGRCMILYEFPSIFRKELTIIRVFPNSNITTMLERNKVVVNFLNQRKVAQSREHRRISTRGKNICKKKMKVIDIKAFVG